MCPRGSVSVRRTPCYPGAAFSGVAFPVSRRLKARNAQTHGGADMFWDQGSPLYAFFDNTFN